MSIRKTLLVSLLAGLAVILGAAGLAVFHRTRAVLMTEFDRALRAQATMVMADIEYDEDGKVGIDLAGGLPTDLFFQLRLPDGQTVGRSPNLEFEDLPARAGDLRLPNGQAGRALIIQFQPLPAEDTQPVNPAVPEVVLVVAGDRAALDRTLAGIGGGLAVVGALVLAATAVVVTLAVRRGLTPLDELGQQLAVSTWQTRFTTRTAELEPVVARLNELLARLDEAFQRERRISADIAHELRTPIAELRTLAEVGVKWPGEAAFTDALLIAKRMETLVTGLLALARQESGQQPVTREPVALQPLVEEIWRPLARPVDVQFAVTGTWRTDPTLLRLIVANLLTNAAEYTTGTIRVTGTDRQLEVTNSVTGLTPEDLPRLFERFWRKDAARTNGHSGLGLVLAQSAATALGLQLTADMPDATTLRMRLE